jgi:hypothetical protein
MDQVSREQLAEAIKSAEDDIMSIVGFPPAPMWIEGNEIQNYPRTALVGSDVAVNNNLMSSVFYDANGRLKGIRADYGKIISGGRRSLVVAGTATVGGGELVYSDDDSDGFYETATIPLPLPAIMSELTDACEFKSFFDGEIDQEWEIRYPRSATITGGNIVLVYDSWLFIDPDLWEAFPTQDGAAAIDVSTVNNFVTTVDVYREYIDTTKSSVRFFWENSAGTSCSICSGIGCETCTYTSQDGCLIARDTEGGIVVPFPATYDEDACSWVKDSYAKHSSPDMVRLWYIAGDQDKAFINCRTCDPMSIFWARIIARMATARLERPICGCGNMIALSERLSQDLSQFSTEDIKECPFGSLRGEVEAWRRIKKILRGKNRKVSTAVL